MEHAWVRGLCIRSSWRDAPWLQHGAFESLTPCFVDGLIVGVVHLVCIVVLGIRLHQLVSQRSIFVRFRKRRVKGLQVFSALAVAVGAILELNMKLGQNMSKEFEADDWPAPYGPGYAPFEMVACSLVAAAALCLTVCLGFEFRAFVTRGQWIVRFVTFFSLAALTVRLNYLIELYHYKASKDYFFYLIAVQFAFAALLGLVALVHWPTQRDFVEMEYRLVPVDTDHTVEDKSNQVCPEASASFIGRLLFTWMTPLMKVGYKRPLQDADVWSLARDDRALTLQARFERHWQHETERPVGKSSLLRALRKTFGWRMAAGGAVKVVNDASQFVGPIILKALIKLSHDLSEPEWKGYYLAAILLLGQLIGALAECQYFQLVMRTGMQVRSTLTLALLKKSVKLSPKGREDRSTGQIMNMISSDCESLQLVCTGIHAVWSSPLRIAIAIYLLYGELGPSAFVALGLLVLMMPVQKQLVGIAGRLLKTSLKATDERVKLINEVMADMQVVKCYAWEASLQKRILEMRTTELSWLRKSAVLRALNFFLISIIPILVTVLTFVTYVAIGNTLTASKAFTSLALFGVLRVPLFLLPQTINNIISARVSLTRLKGFLEADQLTDHQGIAPARTGEAAITVDKASFAWSSVASAKPCLTDIRLTVPAGQMVAVMGGTGEGKSSLLYALLNDMTCVSSSVAQAPSVIRGRVALVPQQAWIFNATVRDNILFGVPYDEQRYETVVRVCSLERDFELMMDGDMTEIGEKGVNLSGGQKQRISLARAVYSDSDVILLDDPLSALDAHVAKEIFDKCFNGFLAGKTRVFVTNRLEFVPSCDRVLVMRQGHIAADGSYSHLLATDAEFRNLMQDQGSAEGTGDASSADADETSVVATGFDGSVQGAPAPDDDEVDTAKAPDEKKLPKQKKEATKLILDEARATGSVGTKVLKGYIKAMGGYNIFFLIVTLYGITEGARLGASVWVSVWSSDGGTGHPTSYWLGIYSGISAVQAMFTLSSMLLTALCGLGAARVLHKQMFDCLLSAPMSFFHATPLGRILNRCSKDQADIDKNLTSNVTIFVRGLIQICGTFIIIGQTTPYTLATFVPVLTVFYWTYRYFQAANREIKRLDSITRSPVYAYFGQCLNGLPSIRAYAAQDQIYEESAHKIDRQVRMNLATFSANRWLSIRLEILGGLMIFASAVFVVAMRKVLDPGQTGLALSYALQITGLLNMTVRLAALAENSFNAVERVLEYTEVESERLEPAPNTPKPPPNWPDQGHIEFRNVSMKYRPDLPPVLQDLSLDAQPSEKIGIVGRTGAGKSSLFLTLFRIVEPCGGSIIIDGIDSASLGLRLLRSRLSIIPQDPVLFTGSVRFNLDPFDEHPDHVVWDALGRAHLQDWVKAQSEGLSTLITEGGSNLSVGQRQLMCLARALVRKSRILVLDEATAAVDVATDSLIQRTIREEFTDQTVLTIAHRLNTIIDSDHILVLDAGRRVEFGTPQELLSTNSQFASMVADTGEEMAAFLRGVAFGDISLDEQLKQQQEQAQAEAVTAATAQLCQPSGAVVDRPIDSALLESVRRQVLGLQASIDAAGQDEDWDEALRSSGLTPLAWLQQVKAAATYVVRQASQRIAELAPDQAGLDIDEDVGVQLSFDALTRN
eukprot:m.293491 g.293491  ORF g.293491 m.293491 type:complete len:1641 (-) comp19492_c0_seq12:32-4954(-)